MLTIKSRNLFLFLFSLSFYISLSQQLPPIIKYSKNEYQAGIQNWMISQDSNGFLYFANNEGLLEFNGSNWTLYPTNNETIMRSVHCINDKIYSGAYMEFGFWERKANGLLTYQSLSESIKDKIQDDEQFWGIFPYDNWILFQSLERIYAYNLKSKQFSIIEPQGKIYKAFKTSKGIFFQTNKGLYEIEQGKSKLFLDNPIINDNRIINILDSKNGLLLVTQKQGIYLLNDENLTRFETNVDTEIQQSNIYSSQLLSNESIALGSISNGIFILNKEGQLNYHITQNNGLSNNTALSLHEDLDKNLWIGLDNGIDCINLQSPIKNYVDKTGTLGTVYASIIYNQKLYIGTNQGLFYKNINSEEKFEFVPKTKGQVWSLFVHQNTLFCGHDSGTFIINTDQSVEHLYKESGTWKFENFEKNKNLILQGHYDGISVLEKKNNQWVFKNKIKNFNYSSKYFELLNDKEVYVSHEYKGVFKFDLDQKIENASNIVKFRQPSKGKNASLAKYNNKILYASKEGVYQLAPKQKEFVKDSLLSMIFENDEYTTGKMIVDQSNKLWFFTKNYIHYYSSGKLSSDLKKNSLPIPASISNSMPGYENITQLDNDRYLIGTTDGFYVLKNDAFKFQNYAVSLTNVTTHKLNSQVVPVNISENGLFNYKENNISFSYTIPEYDKYINAEYQYQLEGFNEKWSDWSFNSQVVFENLPPGDYVFHLRAKVANSDTENQISYSFKIEKPWYANNWAILIYVILFLVMVYYINKMYNHYHQKEYEKIIAENNLLLELKELENEQEIMKIKNEQLTEVVDKKNKELAVSNMNLIKKTELLNIIKEDLKNSVDSGTNRNIKSVISTINKNVKEEDTWNIFKEAFDNVDNDFLKKVKQTHPALTPNDLRLCAYLRLNLSSKEIAPLLNISVRSVEIKRYRLRKKMDLPHETGLVEHILSI